MDGFAGACQVTPIPCFINELRGYGDWLADSLAGFHGDIYIYHCNQ